jgi:prolyl-tRNA editing enzyme YbaK/EbsC (Cys-tRNA(Pro) deacylase)
MCLPDKVIQTTSFFTKKQLWFKLTKNEDALSCEDAAKKRLRNNAIGIPLADELKTYFGEYRVSKTRQQLVLINLPGDCKIDFEIVRSILGISENISLASKKILDFFQIEFGEINPFMIYEMFHEKNIAEIFEGLTVMFDSSLFLKQTTMVTNAGELSWGIEFRASEVINHFQNAIADRTFIESK